MEDVIIPPPFIDIHCQALRCFCGNNKSQGLLLQSSVWDFINLHKYSMKHGGLKVFFCEYSVQDSEPLL